MNLIGISGKIGSGKTTIASILQKQLSPNDVRIVGFADALKQEIANAIGQDISYIEKHKKHFRLIMQGWGTDFRRQLIRDDYWVDQVLRKLAALPNTVHTVVIPDVRFRNEANMIKKVDGKLVRVEREECNHDPALHISEAEMPDFKGNEHIYDYCICNNLGLFELEHATRDMYYTLCCTKQHEKQTT